MNKEQMENYASSHEADIENKCPISGRWNTRVWNVKDGEVLEMETIEETTGETTIDQVVLVAGTITETSNYSAPPTSKEAYSSITGRTYEFKAE